MADETVWEEGKKGVVFVTLSYRDSSDVVWVKDTSGQGVHM
jgi:hypothetical protein